MSSSPQEKRYDESDPRCLEEEWTKKYTSLQDCVEKTRLKAPDWVSWVTVCLFCAMHLLVPVSLGFIAVSYVLCVRGSHIFGAAAWIAEEVFSKNISDVRPHHAVPR